MLTRASFMAALFVLGIAFIAPPQQARADHTGDGHDKPGPPPIITKVKLTTIEHPDMDDGGGDAEVTVTITMEHVGHGTASHTETEPDLDWDITRGTWTINKEIYSHRECTPMEAIKFTVVGLEADASNLDELAKKLVNAAGKLAEGKYSEKLEDLDIDADVIAQVLAVILSIINPDDSLGKGTATATGPGTWTVTTAGGDYSIRVNFSVTTTPVAGNECDPDAPPHQDPPPPWCVIGRGVYDTLYVAFDEIQQIGIEQGNPAGLDAPELMDIVRTCSALTVDIGRWAAIRAVEAAWGFEGARPAYARYLDGNMLEGQAAVEVFKDAFCQAILAILNEVPDPNPDPMPRVACTVGSTITTRNGRDVPFLVGVFGDNAHFVGIRDVLGTPPGSFVQIEPVHPDHPSWWTVTVHQAVPPGDYAVAVAFTDPLVPPQHVTLAVESIPVPVAPSHLVAVRDLPHRASVTWEDHALNELGFRVERKLVGVDPNYIAVGSTGTNETMFTDATLVDPGVYCYRARAFNNGGDSPPSPEGCTTTAAAIEREPSGVPQAFAIEAGYPNPLSETGFVRISVPRETTVSLTLHDVSGKEVDAPLQSAALTPGQYRIRVDASRLAAGLYYVRMEARDRDTGAPVYQGSTRLTFIR